MEGCTDSVVVDLGDISLESQGCIIQMNVTIKNVCPGKRVALAAILTEVDEHGIEYQRGMKTLTIPAHNAGTCKDVLVQCIKFVVPEDQDVSTGTPEGMCSPATSKPGSSPTRWIPIIAAVNRSSLCKAEKHYAPAAL